MADPAAIAKVEQVFAYRFRDRLMLNPVFLAATRTNNEQGETHDGNRSLSQLGTSVIEWVFVQKSILKNEQRKDASELSSWFKHRDTRAAVCDMLGLSHFIQCSPRQQNWPAPSVLALTMSAIIGAIAQDMTMHHVEVFDLHETMYNVLTKIRHQADTMGVDVTTWREIYKKSAPMTIQVSPQEKHPLNIQVADTGIQNQSVDPSNQIGQNAMEAVYQNESTQFHQTVEKIISEELERVYELRGPYHQQTIALLETEELNNIQLEFRDVLKLLYYSAGSPQSFVALRTVLAEARRCETLGPLDLGRAFSTQQRLGLIERLEDNIALFSMLRRYHVLKMFAEHHETVTATGLSFVVETQQTLQAKTKKSGNPFNAADAQVVDRMMRDCYPDISKQSLLYNNKRVFITKLRRLAKKLHMFTSRWGIGILAFLLPSHGDRNLPLFPALTDEKFVTIPEEVLRRFTNLLERNQGDILRVLSLAAEPIVTAICSGSLQASFSWALEQEHEDSLLRCVKGDEALMRTLSKA